MDNKTNINCLPCIYTVHRLIPYKVGAYVRLSKDDSYNESDSIDSQKSIIKDYIEENSDIINT